MGKENDYMKRVAIYIRVSTDKQAKKGDSLAEQTETLNKYVNDHEDMVLYDTYADEGVSGRKIDRDEFREDKERMEKELEELESEPKVKDLSGLREFLKGDWKEIYHTLTDSEKRRLWRSVIKEIWVDDEKNIDIIFL